MQPQKYRSVVLFRNYFQEFLDGQKQKVKDKVGWTLKLLEEFELIPETYLKHLSGTEGLYEIRVQSGNDIFRIFCFFDEGRIIVLMNGFHKKTQKTPRQALLRAIKIKQQYYEEKKCAQKP
jgi:phage-related protein